MNYWTDYHSQQWTRRDIDTQQTHGLYTLGCRAEQKEMRSWGNFSRAESAGNFPLLSLENIFFPKEKTQRGKMEKMVRGCNIALQLKSCWDFFLHLPMSLRKTSWEPCTFRLTDDVGHLLCLTSWMPRDTPAHASCTLWFSCSFSVAALHWGQPRVHYVCKSCGFQPWESNGCCCSCWWVSRESNAEVSAPSQ